MVEINEGVLNLFEMVVRCFDCCMSCAAHMVVVDSQGKEIASRTFQLGLD